MVVVKSENASHDAFADRIVQINQSSVCIPYGGHMHFDGCYTRYYGLLCREVWQVDLHLLKSVAS